ncbi:hypothetical protein ALQ43_200044 [Pseudomonas savastanoi pv. glycinea]|nr:hypothetical protein ALQ43_200044 [Pseudomonas savastanoi pv. glycinea]RMO43272.1 hypothetical protein ALQ41_200122 [Pseudomonas savastanoi pv. glycinea]
MRDVFPGADSIYDEYRRLPRRELAITAGAVLDLALVEILSMKLTGPEQEIHLFLGINGDGRAPCGSFSARIQLALLLSLITERDAAILRVIKMFEISSPIRSTQILTLHRLYLCLLSSMKNSKS